MSFPKDNSVKSGLFDQAPVDYNKCRHCLKHFSSYYENIYCASSASQCVHMSHEMCKSNLLCKICGVTADSVIKIDDLNVSKALKDSKGIDPEKMFQYLTARCNVPENEIGIPDLWIKHGPLSQPISVEQFMTMIQDCLYQFNKELTIKSDHITFYIRLWNLDKIPDNFIDYGMPAKVKQFSEFIKTVKSLNASGTVHCDYDIQTIINEFEKVLKLGYDQFFIESFYFSVQSQYDDL